MEETEAAKPIQSKISPVTQGNKTLESREYELIMNNDTYSLKIELLPNEKISFKIRQINNLSLYYYYNEYGYDELMKNLIIPAQNYDNIEKVFKFYDTALLKNKISLFTRER